MYDNDEEDEDASCEEEPECFTRRDVSVQVQYTILFKFGATIVSNWC